MAPSFSFLLLDSGSSPSRPPPRASSPASFFGLSVFRLVLLVLLVATVPTLAQHNLRGCATSYNPNLDYFPDKANPGFPLLLLPAVSTTSNSFLFRFIFILFLLLFIPLLSLTGHADDFDITYHKNYKLVANIRTNETFALYQCGTPAPTGLDPSVKVFPIPFTAIAITSTVEITFLEMLGVRTSIKFVQDPEYISSACLQAMVTAGVTQALSSNTTIMNEQVATVQGVFVNSADPTQPKFISVSTTQDPGALHRPDWIYFMAAFYNLEYLATNISTTMLARYSCVSTIGTENSAKPKIAWVDYQTYQPTNWWVIDVAQYKLDYVNNLGAVVTAPAVNTFPSPQAWQAAMKDVDIVIDETYLGDMTSFYTNFNLTPSSPFKFLKNGQVWRFDKLQSDLGALDWFESAVPNADTVLEDLLTVFKPQVKFPHTRVWFRNSYQGEPIVVEGATKCPDYSAPAVSRSDECILPTHSSMASLPALSMGLTALCLLVAVWMA